jgi:hypothetical protein
MMPVLTRSLAVAMIVVLTQAACATKVHDVHMATPNQARQCADSEMVTSTHMAVLPIPVVAFFMPRVTFNSVDSSDVLAHCGGKQQVNRQVKANYAACVPTIFLTTIVTLGIVGLCPTYVSYNADVID